MIQVKRFIVYVLECVGFSGIVIEDIMILVNLERIGSFKRAGKWNAKLIGLVRADYSYEIIDYPGADIGESQKFYKNKQREWFFDRVY